jgi:integrase
MTFQELSERWNAAEGPTLKASTLSHYLNALRGYVLPAFESRKIAMINREDIQTFLAEKAKRYSMATLRSIKVTLGLTLGWAHDCGWLSSNPCRHIKLPKQAGGRKVSRTALSAVQIAHLSEKLEEPYATLVLFLAATGLRIGEAIAVTWTDISGAVLAVSRRIYCGDVDQVKSLKSRRELPLDSHLIERMRVLGGGQHWVFRLRQVRP